MLDLVEELKNLIATAKMLDYEVKLMGNWLMITSEEYRYEVMKGKSKYYLIVVEKKTGKFFDWSFPTSSQLEERILRVM